MPYSKNHQYSILRGSWDSLDVAENPEVSAKPSACLKIDSSKVAGGLFVCESFCEVRV